MISSLSSTSDSFPTKCFFPPFLTTRFSSCQIFLPLISAPTGFHDRGLVTRWAQLLITSNDFLPITSKDRSTTRAKLTGPTRCCSGWSGRKFRRPSRTRRHKKLRKNRNNLETRAEKNSVETGFPKQLSPDNYFGQLAGLKLSSCYEGRSSNPCHRSRNEIECALNSKLPCLFSWNTSLNLTAVNFIVDVIVINLIHDKFKVMTCRRLEMICFYLVSEFGYHCAWVVRSTTLMDYQFLMLADVQILA